VTPRGHGPNISAWDAKHGGQAAAHKEKVSTWAFPIMRTPSQSPGRMSDFHQEEVMTPRGQGPNISAWDGDSVVGQVTPAIWQEAVQESVCASLKAGEQRQTTPPYTHCVQVSPLLLSEILQGSGDQLQCTKAVSMGKERFCESFVAVAAARMEAPMQCSEQQGDTTPACLWSNGHCPKQSQHKLKAEIDKKNPKPLVSKGSVGHPYSCAEACKYAKKKRGCKDGASCDHCHLCDWKRYESGRAAFRAAARSKWASQ